jgi:mannose-6-phosphate isomerase
VQKRSDLTVLLEWKGPEIDGRVDGHLGLGFATALAAADRSAVTGGDPSPTSPLPPGFSILVVLGGAGRLVTESGELELRGGRTALVPYSAGEGELDGELDVLRCLPSEASP